MQAEVDEPVPARGQLCPQRWGGIRPGARNLVTQEECIGCRGKPAFVTGLADNLTTVTLPQNVEKALGDTPVKDKRRRKLYEQRPPFISQAGALA